MSVLDPGLSRRRFLEIALVTSAGTVLGCPPAGPALPDWPFTLGVASGDPLPTRVVLWTRLAPQPLAEDGRGGMPPEPVPVVWEVAHDPAFAQGVRSGVAVADPELAHSVHVDVNGLEPDRAYFYRFRAGGHASDVGRTRTFPAPGDAPARMRFASAACQNYKDGFYTAWADVAAQDLDFVVFLGDYIYESGVSGAVRNHDAGRIQDLAGYRNRHALYKGDANLREAHRLFPWIVTWDDHEVANNYAALEPAQTPPPGGFEALRADAYRAWYEHMPVRLLAPKSPFLPIHRRLAFGDLAALFVLDTRQYRTDQECGELGPPCAGFPSPTGSMLGSSQEQWLLDGLAASAARWDVLAQQVVFSPTPIGTLLNFDQWDGYPLARARIVDALAARSERNAVVLSGDIHASGAGYVPADASGFTDPVASEFVATGISSSGLAPELVDLAEQLIEGLPHIDFFEPVTRGYLLHDVERTRWRADFRFVETVAAPTSAAFTAASYEVERGSPDPQPV